MARFNAAVRDVYGNAREIGGEEWFVRLRGEDESVSDAGVRHPLVIDYGDGSYAAGVRPGTMCAGSVVLLSFFLTALLGSLLSLSRSKNWVFVGCEPLAHVCAFDLVKRNSLGVTLPSWLVRDARPTRLTDVGTVLVHK